uniref:ATP-binding protein n=1 Tax=Domibacillus epiphyticus TaxID=1714355 RepID=UPI0038B83070
MGDPAITTAILNRIVHRVEILHLNGDSYRMKHRKTIFGSENGYISQIVSLVLTVTILR